MSAVMQSAPVTAAERTFDFYATEFTTPGLFYAWLESGNSERQPCEFWGPISNNELRDLLLKKPLNPEQYPATMATLRSRFVQEHSAEIKEYAESCTRPADNDWMIRQDKALGACGAAA